LYVRLALPQPFVPAKEPIPLVVYGAASAVGAYAVQLAVRSQIHPIICVAGKGIPFVEGIIDKGKGDKVVDYRKGDEAVVEEIKSALDGKKLLYAFDAVSEKGTYVNICKVLSTDGGKMTNVLPVEKDKIPSGVLQSQTMVGSVHDEKHDANFGYAWFRMFGLGLKEGWLKGHPQEVVPGGLGGVQQGLTNLKEGKASAVKYVFRIADTEGVSKSSL